MFLGIFVGEYYEFYYRIPHFDKVLHFAGGIIATWFVLALMQNEVTRMKWWKQALIFISVTVFIGVVWEWAEYLGNMTKTSAPWFYHYFSGGNLADTLSDLIADTAGAIVATIWALKKERS